MISASLGSCIQARMKLSKPDSTIVEDVSVHLSLLLLAKAGAYLAVGCHEHRRLQAGHTSDFQIKKTMLKAF